MVSIIQFLSISRVPSPRGEARQNVRQLARDPVLALPRALEKPCKRETPTRVPPQSRQEAGDPLVPSGQVFQGDLATPRSFPLVPFSSQFPLEPQELRKLSTHAGKTCFDTPQDRPGLILQSPA